MSEKIETVMMALEIPKEVPDFIKEQLEEGDMLVYATSIHENFLPKPWQGKLAKDSVNQRVLWRHKDPEDKTTRGDVFGRNLYEEVRNDGFSGAYYRIFGGPEGGAEQKLQTLIKKQLEAGEPIGISKGFITKRKNGEIFRVIALEDSITYKPACKQCTTQEVLIEMESKEKLAEEIKKLQEELDAHKLQLEEKNKALETKDKESKKVQEKLDELEAKIEAKDKEVDENKSKKEQLEDKVVALTDTLKKLEASVALERELAKKKPVMDKLYELEKDDDLLEVYTNWDIKKLEDRLAKKTKEAEEEAEKRKAMIQVGKLEEDAAILKNELSEKDVGMKAFRNFEPDEIAMLKKLERDFKLEGVFK